MNYILIFRDFVGNKWSCLRKKKIISKQTFRSNDIYCLDHNNLYAENVFCSRMRREHHYHFINFKFKSLENVDGDRENNNSQKSFQTLSCVIFTFLILLPVNWSSSGCQFKNKSFLANEQKLFSFITRTTSHRDQSWSNNSELSHFPKTACF